MLFRKKGRNLLWENELLVIDAVIDGLSEKARKILNKQLDHVVFVQRIVRKEVNLYYTRGHRNYNPDVPELRTSSYEQLIALAVLRHEQSGELNKCKVWLVKSCLFTLEFDILPKKREKMYAIDSVQILYDPSNEDQHDEMN